jgi:hypothetical protein
VGNWTAKHVARVQRGGIVIGVALALGAAVPAAARGVDDADRAPAPAVAADVADGSLAVAEGVLPLSFAVDPSADPQRRGTSQSTTSDRPHELGLGVRAGGFSFGFGLSVRDWFQKGLGAEADVSHYSVGGADGVGLTQVSLGVIKVLGHPDLSKPTQIRPYVTGGINISHDSAGFCADDFSGSCGGTGLGGQVAVGAEFVLAGAPKFGFGGDVGYYGGVFGFGGIALSVTGHYYIK